MAKCGALAAYATLGAPDAGTDGVYKADLFERFNAEYRQCARLMDRYLPNAGAESNFDRLARLTALRAYVRALWARA